mmetsp:Transcript_12292/g.19927  ORF Transcript_12292/g.19927 Transcript_12292/m.19927 type:complete len:495 (-) Transcript_12292:86-1570(-)
MFPEQSGGFRLSTPPIAWHPPSDNQKDSGVLASAGLHLSTPGRTRASTAPAAPSELDAHSPSRGALSASQQLARDVSSWSWPDTPIEEPCRPISASSFAGSLAVRRLVPRKVAVTDFKATQITELDQQAKPRRNHLGKRQSMQRLATWSPPSLPNASLFDKDDLLLVRSVSTPSMRRRQPRKMHTQYNLAPPTSSSSSSGPQIAKTDVQMKVRVHTKVQLHDSDRWKDFAKEAAAWLKEFPKHERFEAVAKMKEWVKASGLDWHAWWDYIENLDAELGASLHQRSQSYVPRTFARCYNRSPKSHPKIAAVQTQLGSKPNARRPMDLPRPCTEDDWYAVASECMAWLDRLDDSERPSAMVKMRQWIVASGLEWDHWWDYCRRLRSLELREFEHQNAKAGSAGQHQTSSQDKSEADNEPPAPEKVFFQRRFAASLEPGRLEESPEEAQDDKIEKIPKGKSQGDWQSTWLLKEQLQKDCHSEWKKNTKEYCKAALVK